MTGVGWAGGTPENILLIIDPTNNDSMYVGNYYKNARNIPDSNVIYMNPGAMNYTTFAADNLDALFGSLANAGTLDHIDYIVVLPGANYFVSAPGLISDGCFPVSSFSISGCYTLAFVSNRVLGGLSSQTDQQYWRGGPDSQAFDSSITWLNGLPGTGAGSERYFIGAMLGYSGLRGNTLAETIEMIDRSVAADGTRPSGTFYFMETTDAARSGPRHDRFDAVVSAIIGLGGAAVHLLGILPTGQHDCLGIMTGWASPGIRTADMTILPGAFCDHLTSFAGAFAISSQEKVSDWIAKGASGSWGAVEEPCNYAGKFPHPRIHLHYYKGLSLGEAALRSGRFMPFQMLLYGDPMTRPFAHIPAVNVAGMPAGAASGTVTLTPSATTTHPTATINVFELLIDGVSWGSVTAGQQFVVDTTLISDGYHDVRVIGYENTAIKSAGRWIGAMNVNNAGRSVTLGVTPSNGNWTTGFSCNVNAAGGGFVEVRVVQNGRVLAAAPGSSALLTVWGATIGAGPARLQGEGLRADGSVVRSEPVNLNISYGGGTPSGAPVAFNYTKHVLPEEPFVVELPATFNNASTSRTYVLLTNPTKATVPSGQTSAYRLMRPSAGACGTDAFTFRVDSSGAGSSNVATVTLVYDYDPCDVNCDGTVNPFDIQSFTDQLLPAPPTPCKPCAGDVDGNGTVNPFDITPFLSCLN